MPSLFFMAILESDKGRKKRLGGPDQSSTTTLQVVAALAEPHLVTTGLFDEYGVLQTDGDFAQETPAVASLAAKLSAVMTAAKNSRAAAAITEYDLLDRRRIQRTVVG
jgi:hypothetical protein